MRTVRLFLAISFLQSLALAADLKVKVVDPLAAPVAGVQVLLVGEGATTPLGINNTSGDGIAVFRGLSDGRYKLQILAPGFAPGIENVSFPQSSSVTISLQIATPTENVVVSATRSPAPVEEIGASVSALDASQLNAMQPVSAADAIGFLPGAIVATTGQRGAQASLFVRGGDSRYNKVLIDGVPVDDPGGIFDFGVVPLAETDRLEFLRGAQSTLYGSDAMTSVVQIFTRTGSMATPELRFGADGGNLGTARGYASVSGARGLFDYNLFADQFNTSGQGVNNDYSNSLQGGNVGVQLDHSVALRVRVRHANSRSGIPGEWNFNGEPLLAPDIDARARQNNLVASADLVISTQSQWQHRWTGFEYNHRTLNRDDVPDRGCDPAIFNFTDCFFSDTAHINRAGFNYQGDYTPRVWAQTTVGYEFEDENAVLNSAFLTTDANGVPIIGLQQTRGLRLNHALFAQQRITRGRISLIGGLRYIHNDSFGDRAVPRFAATFLALKGGGWFSGTRFRFAYAGGIKEPRFEESFGISGIFPSNPNPNLKAEENRSIETGLEQSLFGGKYALSAVYYHNLFRNQIEFETLPITFVGEYVNVNRSLAHGAELEFSGRPMRNLSLHSSYTYTSTQILEAPLCTPENFCDPLLAAGQPLIRRPRHSGTLLLSYQGSRWGTNLGGSFVGRRPDSDFEGLGFNHAAGYARMDFGGWHQINSHLTAYFNVENALNKHYEEVVGYPALRINFRAGLRFRVGGD
jgi:vitamin B12 transporter